VIVVSLREWETVIPERGGPTWGVSLEGAAARALAERLTDGGRLVVRELRTGLELQSKSWVGRVRLGDLDVVIQPKLAPELLMALVGHCYGFDQLELHGPIDVHAGDMSIADLLVHALCEEGEALLRSGLHRRYVRRTEVLAAPRGRLDFASLSKGPLLSAELPCAHHPRDVAWPVNRALCAGLNFAASLAETGRVRARALALRDAWAEQVQPAPIDLRAIRRMRATLDRMTERYDRALSLVEALLDAISLSVADEESPRLAVAGFLFDMNRFFQTLVVRFLERFLDGVRVRAEVPLRGLVSYAEDANPRAQDAPLPRPDLEVTIGRTKIILDAKYRDLWARELPREMLYQLALYASATPTRSATILYPTSAPAAREARVVIRDATGGPRTVSLRPVPLARLEAAFRERGRAARDLARELAFGSSEVAVSAHAG